MRLSFQVIATFMYTSRNIRGNLNCPISSSKMRPSAYVQEMATRYGSEELEQAIRQSLSKFHSSFDQGVFLKKKLITLKLL